MLGLFGSSQMPTGNISMSASTRGVRGEGGIGAIVYDSLIDDSPSHGTEDCALEGFSLDADSSSGSGVTAGVGVEDAGGGGVGERSGREGGESAASVECVRGQMARVQEMLQGMRTS